MLLPYTFTEGRFPWPSTVTSADSVLRSSSQVEPLLAGVDQCVPQSWQVHGSHVHITGGLRLSARMGWEMATSEIQDFLLNKIKSCRNEKTSHVRQSILTNAFWLSSTPGEVLQARSCCRAENVVIFAALERDFTPNLRGKTQRSLWSVVRHAVQDLNTRHPQYKVYTLKRNIKYLKNLHPFYTLCINTFPLLSPPAFA